MQIARNVFLVRRVKLQLAVFGRIEQSAFGSIQRGPQGQQFKQRQAHAVDIAARIGIATELFRSHVSQGPEQFPSLRLTIEVFTPGQSKVGYPNCPGVVQKQVAGLDVSMQHTRLVGIVQGVGNFGNKPTDVAIVVFGNLLDRRLQWSLCGHGRFGCRGDCIECRMAVGIAVGALVLLDCFVRFF